VQSDARQSSDDINWSKNVLEIHQVNVPAVSLLLDRITKGNGSSAMTSSRVKVDDLDVHHEHPICRFPLTCLR
jgi:hypothetical protein